MKNQSSVHETFWTVCTSYLPYVILLVLIFLIYGQSLYYEHVFDDHSFFITPFSGKTPDFFTFINQNRFSEGGTFYRPLFIYSIWLDMCLHQFNSFYSHLENIFVFFMCACFVFKISLILFDTKTALVTSLLFSCLPVHVESVAFISARDTLLSGLGVFGSLYFYLNYSEALIKKIIPLLCMSLFAVLAVFSKESGLMIPILFLVVTPFCLYKKSHIKKAIVPMLVVTMVIVVFLIFKHLHIQSTSSRPMEFLGGNGSKQIVLMIKLIYAYLENIFYPMNLSVEYVLYTDYWDMNQEFFIALIAVICCTSVVSILKMRLSVKLLLAFLASLLPFLHIFKLHHVMTDRWAFVPSFFILLLFVSVCMSVFKHKLIKYTGLLFLSGLIVCNTAHSFKRVPIWKNDRTLFESILSHNPQSITAHFNLGNYYFNQHQLDTALHHFNQVLEVNSNHVGCLTNLGYLYLKKRDFEMSKHYFDLSLVLFPDNSYAKHGLMLWDQLPKQKEF